MDSLGFTTSSACPCFSFNFAEDELNALRNDLRMDKVFSHVYNLLSGDGLVRVLLQIVLKWSTASSTCVSGMAGWPYVSREHGASGTAGRS